MKRLISILAFGFGCSAFAQPIINPTPYSLSVISTSFTAAEFRDALQITGVVATATNAVAYTDGDATNLTVWTKFGFNTNAGLSSHSFHIVGGPVVIEATHASTAIQRLQAKKSGSDWTGIVWRHDDTNGVYFLQITNVGSFLAEPFIVMVGNMTNIICATNGTVSFPYGISGYATEAYAQSLTNGFVDASVTNGLATTNYAQSVTNGLAGPGITNGLATTNYAQSLTNGFVDASVTNGLASITYAQGLTNGFTDASVTNGLASQTYAQGLTNGFATTNYTHTVASNMVRVLAGSGVTITTNNSAGLMQYTIEIGAVSGHTVFTNGVSAGTYTNINFVGSAITNTDGNISIGITGGTGSSPTTTLGDMIYHNGTDDVRLPIGKSFDSMYVYDRIASWQSIPIHYVSWDLASTELYATATSSGGGGSAGVNQAVLQCGTKNSATNTIYGTNGIGATHYGRIRANSGAAVVNLVSNTVFEVSIGVTAAITNLMNQVGYLSALNESNQTAGIFWQYNYALCPTSWVARCIGVSSLSYTSSVGPVVDAQCMRLGFYGTTNRIVFTTNGIPCFTNSDASTMPVNTTLSLGNVTMNSVTNSDGLGSPNTVVVDWIKYGLW